MSDIRSHLEEFAASPEIEMRLRSFVRQCVFVVILLAVWISTKPFNVIPTDGTVIAGDIVNQLTFSGLAILSFICMIWVHPRALMPMAQPSYLIMFVWMGLSVLNSTYFDVSFRAFAFTTIIIFLAAAIFVLPERLRQFQTLFFVCCLITVGLSYFGVIALPTLARHTDIDPFEPEHAGSWKGHFDHKNIAGASMAAFAIAGVYAIRIGRTWMGWPLLVGSVIFLYFTNSKTAFALLPVSLFLAYITERVRFLPLRLLICIGPIFVLIALTIGSVFFPEIREFNKAVLKDPGFTGRYDIWRYGFEMLAYKPWFGYGFEAFWQTEITLKGESRLDLAWAVEKIIHGHNSYLDIALTMGGIGLLLVIYVFVVKPVFDYHRSQASEQAQPLATMFLAIWLFVSLDMCLETYYFRRSDPVWFALLLAVLGLRFSAVFPVDQSPSQADQAS
jgi:O-antigen ligase